MINRKLKAIHFTIAVIAIGQVIWWAYLLITQQYELAGLLKTEAASDKAHRFKIMITSEGAFFIFVWCVALWSAYRSLIEQAGLRKAHADFLSAVTHELKTPIANIRLCLDTLERPNLAEDMKTKYVERGQQALNRLLSEIESVLQLTHSEQREMIPQELNLYAVVATCIDNIDPSVLSTIEVKNSVAPQTRVLAPLDETRIVIQNILDNAVKYTRNAHSNAPGRIVISAQARGHNIVELEITDNGIGLEAKEVERIFDPFWRSENAVKQAKSGTGVGLALAKSLASRAGLKLEIESAGVLKGVTARLVFPKVQDAHL